MFKQMSVEDQITLFSGAVVLYNKKPTKIDRISNGGAYHIRDLQSQKTSVVQDAYKKITPPYTRIGMVNALGSVIYCERKPIRQYSVGFTRNNIQASTIKATYPDGSEQTLRYVLNLSCVELFEALTNKYPSLKDAAEFAAEFRGASAFDKQFAICDGRQIHYKRKVVGALPRGMSKVEDIIWKPEFANLSLLLENNYEKAVSASR